MTVANDTRTLLLIDLAYHANSSYATATAKHTRVSIASKMFSFLKSVAAAGKQFVNVKEPLYHNGELILHNFTMVNLQNVK